MTERDSQSCKGIRNLNDEMLGAGIKSLLDCTVQTIDVAPVKQYLETGGDRSKLGRAEQYALAIADVRERYYCSIFV